MSTGRRKPTASDGEREWLRHVKTTLIPKMQRSGMGISLLPEGELDAKFAVELGLLIMMDKPIIAIVRPGVHVSEKMVLVADRIIECDMNGIDDTLAVKVAQAVKEITAEREEREREHDA